MLAQILIYNQIIVMKMMKIHNKKIMQINKNIIKIIKHFALVNRKKLI